MPLKKQQSKEEILAKAKIARRNLYAKIKVDPILYALEKEKEVLNQFKIEPLDQSWKDRCLELIMNVLLTDDPIIRELGFSSDPVSVQSLRSWIEMHFNQNITIGCFLKSDEHHNDNNILVAIDGLYVRNIRDEFPNLTEDDGDAFRNFIKYIKFVERHIRYPNAEKFCNFLASFGVIIMPKYANDDIKNHMIKVRKCFAKVLHIEYLAGVFVTDPLLKGAAVFEKYKYRWLKVFHNQEEMDCGLNFSSEVFPITLVGRSSCRGTHYIEYDMDGVNHLKRCPNLRVAAMPRTSAGTNDDRDREELDGFDPQAPQVDLSNESIVEEETMDDD